MWDRAAYKPLAPRGACPKIFVYDLPELWSYPTPLSQFKNERADAIFGQRCEESEYVIFSLQNELVAPWFVPRGVAVRLSEKAYGNGTFRALDVLRRIPREEIRRRQSIIRKHGHRLQYAVDDLGEEPDAVETLFVGALGLAHDLAHLYQV